MPKDDLGIEYDDDVDVVLKDPKSTVLSKTVEYMLQRAQVKEALARKKSEEENKPEKLFGIF